MTSEGLVVSSFNRSFPQIIAQSSSGIFAYGCRNDIYLIDVRCHPPTVLDSKCIQKAYKEKVAALSFCKCENSELLASISDCGVVKIWDTNTRTCVNNYVVKEGMYNIEWIYGSPNTLVFSQDANYLLKWNFVTNNIARIRLGSDLKTCFLSSNEKSPNLLAIGHNSGAITVLDIVQEKVLHRFKEHAREINILTWNPVLPNTLLSVSLDYSVRLWKMGEEKSTKLFWLGRFKVEDKRRIRVLGICHPHVADVIICSNAYGDMGEVRLSEEKPRLKPYSKMATDVSCRHLKALVLGTLKTEQGAVDCLYCFDNYMLSIWNITEKKLESFIPFSMGFIYDVSFSPTNPIYMSICAGDGMVRIWNAQADSQISKMISVFVQGKTKITNAAWHPTLENIIAFATEEGKLGIIDTIKKKSLYPYETIHKNKVYSLCWGPYKASLLEDAGFDEHFLYSSGAGEIFINRCKKLNKPAINFYEVATRPVDLQTNEDTSNELTWKPDYSLVCIGTFRGFIEVYDEKLVFLTLCNLDIRFIESMKWHPENTYMSPTGTPLKFWLACAGNDCCIYILDTSKISEEKNEGSSNCVAKKLTGHRKRIEAICWSPHKDGYLVSASKDGCALVWNACTGNIIVSFLNHADIVITVQWSMFDEDIIYSGGQDCFVRAWKISDQSSVAPADKVRIRKALKRPKSEAIEKLQDFDAGIASQNENTLFKNESTCAETSETNMNKDKITEINGTDNTDEDVVPAVSGNKTADKFSWQGKQVQAFWLGPNAKNSVSLFGNIPTLKEEDLKDCIRLTDILCRRTQECEESFDLFTPNDGILSDSDAMQLGFYTDQNTALKMADVRASQFKSQNQLSKVNQISVMANKMEFIKEAAVNGTLSSYLVSLAPSVSYSFWLEMCEKYAIQLLQEQQPYVACTYFLMCNKVYEAIDVLIGKGKLYDALVLAKLRLPESDPIIFKLLRLIRERCRRTSDPLGEAKCYLTLNEPLLAIKTLGAVPDASCVKIAVYICKKHNMNEAAEKYKFIFMQRCLMQCDWESFRELINQEPDLQVYSTLFAVHEAFYKHLRDVKTKSGISLSEIFSLPKSNKVKFWSGTTCIDSDVSFIQFVCDVLTSKNLLPTTEDSLGAMIKSLDNFSSKWDVSETSSDAHVAIAVYITKFILLASAGDSAAATANFLKIFSSSCNIVFLPRVVFMLFFPINLLWRQDTKSIVCQSKVHSLESNTHQVIMQYQLILQRVSEEIMTKSQPFDLSIVSKENLQNDLYSVTEKIASALSLKDCSEFILTYFVSYIVHDLFKIMDKKVVALECYAKKINSDLKNNVNENIVDKTVAEIPSECSSIDKTGIQEEVEALIEATLQEADEKIRTLTNLEASNALENASENSFQIENTPDSYSNKMSSNDEKVCEKEVIPNIGSEKPENALKSNCYNEIYSSENMLSVENCTSLVHSGDDNSHNQCLASIDLFYHVILFLMSNICKEEFVLLYYLKEHLASLQVAKASDERNKFSKANLIKSRHCSEINRGNAKVSSDLSSLVQNHNSLDDVLNTKTSEQASMDDDKESLVQSHNSVDEIQSTEANQAKDSIDGDDKESLVQSHNSVDEIQSTETNQVKASIDDDDDKKEYCNSFEFSKIPSIVRNDKNVCSNDHNYSSPQEIHNSINKLDINSSQVRDENLLKELPELIHLLESKAKGIPYPSPLDIVPKVLQILYNVRQKSTCNLIQEKLHMLIDDIVAWAGTFQVANTNLVCTICH